LHLKTKSDTKLNALQKIALQKAHTLFGFEAASNGFPNFLSKNDLNRAIIAATDTQPTEHFLDTIISNYSVFDPYLSFQDFEALMISGTLFPEHANRHYVAISLAEAETIRRILHLRKRKDPLHLIANQLTEVCLRYSPMSTPSCAPGGDGGVVFDASNGWIKTSNNDISNNRSNNNNNSTNNGNSNNNGNNSISFNNSGATVYEAAVAHSCFRFFDCDMHFTSASLHILIKALKGRFVFISIVYFYLFAFIVLYYYCFYCLYLIIFTNTMIYYLYISKISMYTDEVNLFLT
jgi:hypothetical protein